MCDKKKKKRVKGRREKQWIGMGRKKGEKMMRKLKAKDEIDRKIQENNERKIMKDKINVT